MSAISLDQWRRVTATPLIFLSCAWLSGLYLGSFLMLPWEGMFALGTLILVLLMLWWPVDHIRLILLGALVLLTALWRYQAVLPHFGEQHIAYYNEGGVFSLRGWVSSEPEIRDRWATLRVTIEELSTSGQWLPVSGEVLVRTPWLPAYSYGDRLELKGRLETPPQIGSFSYRDYLARQGIYAMLRYPHITRLEPGGYTPLAWIYRLKDRLAEVLGSLLPEPQSSLAQGILLGRRSGIPAELLAAFNQTNTSHIIAISGFNISLIAGMLATLAGRWNRRRAVLLVIVGVVLYTLLVGASASVMRAAIMSILAIGALYYGRPNDALTALAVAGVMMTGLNPFLLWDVAFQLSFLATAGLLLLQPLLQDWLRRLPLWFRESLSVTLAAQLATLPIIVLNFYQASLVTPLANLLALPAFPGIMLWGGAAGLLGLLWAPLALPFAWIAWLHLTYMISIVELCARLPFSSFSLTPLPGALGWLYYAVLLAALMLVQRRAHGISGPSQGTLWSRPFLGRAKGDQTAIQHQHLSLKTTLSTLLLLIVTAWAAIFALPDGKTHLTFFDVGQGDAILLQSPTNQKILIDGGPSPLAISNALGRRLPFWDRTIDLVIATHPHEDHITGLLAVMQRYRVKQVLDSGYPHNTPTYRRWLEAIREKGLKRTVAKAGQEITLGQGIRLEIIHPGEELLSGTPSDANNNSVVVRLRMGAATILLAGDLEEDGQRYLLRKGQALSSNILKVPHQGGHTALDSNFLAAVHPEAAIILVGKDNRFGHPAPETLEKLRGTPVYRTDLNGTIEVVIDEAGYRIRTER
ncbi:MAG: DNA internalization-related competence protein ComEC/Rec2 [Chloroflexi bacterium]|nr:DNA internalization-related competence protein ComEC/Rec2 [Chloroflexota bacterium]